MTPQFLEKIVTPDISHIVTEDDTPVDSCQSAKQLQREDELNGSRLKIWALTADQYVEMPESFWLQTVGLGLMVWKGEFEEQASTWLRWCDCNGQVIPTGAEGRDLERQGREVERQWAERLAERLRAMGVNPDEI